MDASSLITEAAEFYDRGEHGEAVARLTSALKSNLNSDDTERVEELINKVGLHVFDHSVGQNGISREMVSSFFTPSQSQHTQLGKLALLATLLASSQKEKEGNNDVVQKAVSLLHGHHSSSGGGSNFWTSLESKFFGHGVENTSQRHDTSTKSRLYNIASSYMASEGGRGYMFDNQTDSYSRNHEGPLAHHNDEGHHAEGHHGALSNLASVASKITGHANGHHEEPVAYGDPNRGANGCDFTAGPRLAPM